MWLYGFAGLTSQYVCPLGLLSWEGVEILHAIQYDPQQPIDSTFAWQWMDFDQYDGRYHGTIIHSRLATVLPLSNYDTRWYTLLNIFRGITRYSEQSDFKAFFEWEIRCTIFLLCSCFKCRFSFLNCPNALIYWLFAYPNPFFILCDFDVYQNTPSWCCNFNERQCNLW